VTPSTSSRSSTAFPFVSVIIPARNEAGHIERTLEAVFAQDYPASLTEVIVAEGLSRDRTRAILEELASAHHNMVIIDNPAGIVPTGLNRALKIARGEIIVRVDAHTIVRSDYVSRCVQTLARTNAQNVGGRMNPQGGTVRQRAIATATTSPFGIGGSRFHYSTKEEWVDTVYMGAWPREVFDRIGGFDEEQVRNQDDEFNYRLVKAGGKVYLNPAISSVYSPRSSWRALWRQYFQYGYWKVRVMQKHPSRVRYSQLIPTTFVVTILYFFLLGFVVPSSWILASGILGVYLLAALASAYKSSKEQPILLPAVAAAFPILHVSYGTGFLLGLLKFRDRWNLRRNRHKASESVPMQSLAEGGRA